MDLREGTPDRPRRGVAAQRRWQFSLRQLLGLVLLTAVGMKVATGDLSGRLSEVAYRVPEGAVRITAVEHRQAPSSQGPRFESRITFAAEAPFRLVLWYDHPPRSARGTVTASRRWLVEVTSRPQRLGHAHKATIRLACTRGRVTVARVHAFSEEHLGGCAMAPPDEFVPVLVHCRCNRGNETAHRATGILVETILRPARGLSSANLLEMEQLGYGVIMEGRPGAAAPQVASTLSAAGPVAK